MTTPSIDELKQPTLKSLAEGITDSDEIRRRIAQNYDIHSADVPHFTNNHAWALVRLQQDGLVQKLARKSYTITELGRAWLREAGFIETHRLDPPAVGAMPAWARRLIYTANRENGLDGPRFTEEHMVALWESCNGRCKLTGLDFSDEKVGLGQAKRAYAPSLDRINPEGLYTVDNCRLVMVAINFALNRWGEEVYLKLARAAIATADRQEEVAGWRVPSNQAGPA